MYYFLAVRPTPPCPALRAAESRARQMVFVVFRRPAAAPARTIARGELTTLATIGGAWDVAFSANLGAPPRADLGAHVG